MTTEALTVAVLQMSPQLGTTPFTRLDLCAFMCQILLHIIHGLWHFYTGILHTWVHFYTGILENDKGPSVVLIKHRTFDRFGP